MTLLYNLSFTVGIDKRGRRGVILIPVDWRYVERNC